MQRLVQADARARGLRPAPATRGLQATRGLALGRDARVAPLALALAATLLLVRLYSSCSKFWARARACEVCEVSACVRVRVRALCVRARGGGGGGVHARARACL